ncbi:myeloid differentiation primary response protein MyD88 [Fundulus diaphanus]
MDETDSKVDLCSIPLIALNVTVRKKLGLYLNPKHTVAADWTAVAETMGFSYLEIKNYEASRSPTKTVLDDWAARNSDASVGKLLSILEEVERKDIVEDLQPLIDEDVRKYIENQKKKDEPPVQVPEVDSCVPRTPERSLTVEDVPGGLAFSEFPVYVCCFFTNRISNKFI